MRKLFIFAIISLLILNIVLAEDLFNTTAYDESNNIYEQILALNPLTDNLLGICILLIVYFMAFSIGGGDGIAAGFMSGGFAAAFTATIFLPLGLIDFLMYQRLLIILAAPVAISIIINSSGGKI